MLHETQPGDAEYTGIVVLTSYDEHVQAQADLTLGNKEAYCAHQGYPFVVKTGWYEDIMDGNRAGQHANKTFHQALVEMQGLMKCGMLRQMLRRFPKCSWVFITETDMVITNPNVRLETFTEATNPPPKHFIASADLNAPNAGSFFLRNSVLGKSFLDMMCAGTPIYKSHGWAENQFFIDMWRTLHFKETTMTVLPQRSFNSYDWPHLDILGTEGLWQDGDFMVHFAGMGNKARPAASLNCCS